VILYLDLYDNNVKPINTIHLNSNNNTKVIIGGCLGFTLQLLGCSDWLLACC